MSDLFECLALSEGAAAGEARVDREKGIIRNVKVLGWRSANGREYDPKGVDPRLYEGRPVNADHVVPGKQGSVKDTFAWLEGTHARPDGIYARQLRLLNPQGEFEQRLMTAADDAPHLFGLSHTAKGRQRQRGGANVIEAVEKVQSVDLVRDPATVSSLYESRNHPMKQTLTALTEALKASRPKYAATLKEMAEAGIMSPSSMMDPPAGGDEATPVDHEQAILDACKACIDDEALDSKGKLSKIKELLKVLDKGGDSGGGSGDNPFAKKDGDDDGGDDDKEESRKKEAANLREENARLKAEKKLRAKAEKAGVKIPEALVESLKSGITDAETDALVASLGAARGQKARSAPPPPAKGKAGAGTVTESRDPALVPEGDGKAIGRWLNGGR